MTEWNSGVRVLQRNFLVKAAMYAANPGKVVDDYAAKGIPKAPGLQPPKAPKPPVAFKPKVPKLMSPSLKPITGAASGTIT